MPPFQFLSYQLVPSVGGGEYAVISAKCPASLHPKVGDLERSGYVAIKRFSSCLDLWPKAVCNCNYQTNLDVAIMKRIRMAAGS